MWLRYYIEDKVGVCIIDSIPHCFSKHFSMAVWNTIDDTMEVIRFQSGSTLVDRRAKARE